jgi:hypothetical protein
MRLTPELPWALGLTSKSFPVCKTRPARVYNRVMPAKPQSVQAAHGDDTSYAARRAQIRIWRSLSSVDVAELVSGASRAARTLALAGLRARHPAASERELIARLAAITIGTELARQVYPDVDFAAP